MLCSFEFFRHPALCRSVFDLFRPHARYLTFWSFQKWVRNHAQRSASSSSGAAAATSTTSYADAATAAAAAASTALGPRSSYHERATSAPPLRRQWLLKRQEAWSDCEGEGERSGEESEGFGGGGTNRRRSTSSTEEEEREREREREQKEEKRRKVDRTFRAWLDRKKKQAQAEREAQRRREEALTKLRYGMYLWVAWLDIFISQTRSRSCRRVAVAPRNSSRLLVTTFILGRHSHPLSPVWWVLGCWRNRVVLRPGSQVL